ncbi:MAG: D-alanine--D-alanine ligase [Holosporaceae bacterium]|jgi:D-alanine-D-alanine ligase|nr:D-alanine--D-alanine ligase [Holosporaceae bacterium]
MEKIRLAILFGGRSSEHDISVKSAESIIRNLDKNKYEILLVGVDREGRAHFGADFISTNVPLATPLLEDLKKNAAALIYPDRFAGGIDGSISACIDAAFPIFHGSYGEDGAIQGLLRMLQVPFVGAGVLGSAIGMDKDVTKRLLREAGIPVAKHLTYERHEKNGITYEKTVSKLGNVVFVKPASLGSSVGVNKVCVEAEFYDAVAEAYSYDNKIIIEEYIDGREIECAILGNEHPEASVLGEIIVHGCFYSYSAKYLNEYNVNLKIPADLTEEVSVKIREMAVKAFKVLCCEGMARVDFFLKDNAEVLVNEINTIPGFTEISMYPKLWEASGVEYGELLDRLITLAISRYNRDNDLRIDSSY